MSPYLFASSRIPQNTLGLLLFGGVMKEALPTRGYLGGPGGKFFGFDVLDFQ